MSFFCYALVSTSNEWYLIESLTMYQSDRQPTLIQTDEHIFGVRPYKKFTKLQESTIFYNYLAV